uniref:Uncharacterized protein n=1 Tax=Ralstonia solanacearum TaxID=305 RepID=A0A0S4UW14_RALSL|nr:protein of unknown function [Ralstonia solanacearum]CUV37620.1 protein of unknown function [Ralstonia solanacearum]CUV42583.1 protein of unknown function [Ralstonia solanacearum]CUV60487.1 protein of unknown function [Ralstonia solanacearum]
MGQINWNDDDKRKALRTNLAYLAKAEQYVMLKDAENMRYVRYGPRAREGKGWAPSARS